MIHGKDERRATPAPTHRRGGARHDRQQYIIHTQAEKAQRVLQRLHGIPGLYDMDRDLIIRVQYYIKEIKTANNYTPQTSFRLFDP